MNKNEYEDCVFCTIAYNKGENLPEYDRPILQTEDFFVIPAMGQFIEGYVLICPREHFINLSAMNKKLYSRFLEVKNRVKLLLHDVYGQQPLFFEHGPVSDRKRGGSCVDHAHLHAIPINMVEPPSMLSENLVGGKIKEYESVIEHAKSGKPYFYIEFPDGTMYMYDAVALPCQYGRQLVAHQLGLLDQWDWHKYPHIERMLKTSCLLRECSE